MVALRSLSSRTREHGEVPLGSAFVEAEDVKGIVRVLDFAIAVIGTVPLVEHFDHLDPIHVQTKRPGYLSPMVPAGLYHDAHVYASGAAQALSNGSIPSVHALRTARCGGDCYSFTLMPASLISFAHCGISDLILAAKSGGVLATISMPRSSRCLRASFCARTRAVSL